MQDQAFCTGMVLVLTGSISDGTNPNPAICMAYSGSTHVCGTDIDLQGNHGHITELQAVLISCMRNSILLSGKREAWGGHKSVPEHALDGGTNN